MVLTGRGTVLENCTHGIPMVNPTQIRAKFKEEDCHFITCEALTSGAHLVDVLVEAARLSEHPYQDSPRL